MSLNYLSKEVVKLLLGAVKYGDKCYVYASVVPSKLTDIKNVSDIKICDDESELSEVGKYSMDSEALYEQAAASMFDDIEFDDGYYI